MRTTQQFPFRYLLARPRTRLAGDTSHMLGKDCLQPAIGDVETFCLFNEFSIVIDLEVILRQNAALDYRNHSLLIKAVLQ